MINKVMMKAKKAILILQKLEGNLKKQKRKRIIYEEEQEEEDQNYEIQKKYKGKQLKTAEKPKNKK